MSLNSNLTALLANTQDDLKNASVLATYIWASVAANMSQQTRDVQSAQGLHFKSEIFASKDLTAFCERTAAERPYDTIELTEKFLQASTAQDHLRESIKQYVRDIFHQIPPAHSARMINVYEACNAPLLARYAQAPDVQ